MGEAYQVLLGNLYITSIGCKLASTSCWTVLLERPWLCILGCVCYGKAGRPAVGHVSKRSSHVVGRPTLLDVPLSVKSVPPGTCHRIGSP